MAYFRCRFADGQQGTVEAGGYLIEAMLPWSNLGLTPQPGSEVAFQLVANDDDGEADADNGPLRVAWFPSLDSHHSSHFMNTLRLAEAPSTAELALVDRRVEPGSCTITVRTGAELDGREVVVRGDGRVLARAALSGLDGRVGTVIDVHIGRLRRKMDDGFSPPLLHTIRGLGFTLREDPP